MIGIRFFIFLPVAVLSAAFIGHSKTVRPEEFQNSISPYRLTFTLPAGYRAVPVKKNEDLAYDFAIRNKRSGTEIRYSVFPFSKFSEQYQRCVSSSTCLIPPPENQFREMLHTTLGKINRGPDYRVQPLASVCCRKFISADTGAYCNMSLKGEDRYPFLQVIHLNKRGSVDIIMQVLSQQPPLRPDTLSQPLSTLKFY